MSAQGIGPKNQTCEQLPPAEPVTFVTQLLTLLGAAQFPQLGGGKTHQGSLTQCSPPRQRSPLSQGARMGTRGSFSEEVSTTTTPMRFSKRNQAGHKSISSHRNPAGHHRHPKEDSGESIRNKLDPLALLIIMCVLTLPSASCRKALLLGWGSVGFFLFLSYEAG